jgi:hypothetical protein
VGLGVGVAVGVGVGVGVAVGVGVGVGVAVGVGVGVGVAVGVGVGVGVAVGVGVGVGVAVGDGDGVADGSGIAPTSVKNCVHRFPSTLPTAGGRAAVAMRCGFVVNMGTSAGGRTKSPRPGVKTPGPETLEVKGFMSFGLGDQSEEWLPRSRDTGPSHPAPHPAADPQPRRSASRNEASEEN